MIDNIVEDMDVVDCGRKELDITGTELLGLMAIRSEYGGSASHGGGAFSGKDPKVGNRSAACVGGYFTKNVVAIVWAERCASYAIGVALSLSTYADPFDTAQVSKEQIKKAVSQCMYLIPSGICRHLGLRNLAYQRTVAYRHFGRLLDANGVFS